MKQSLKICTTEVLPDGQGTVARNDERIRAARQVIDAHGGFGAQLFAFPAGFLRATREDDVVWNARVLLRYARERGHSLLIGVDTQPLKKLPQSRVEQQKLPSFLIGCTPDMRLPVVWRQRCRSRHDPLPDGAEAARILLVGKHRVAPLIGGEVFNARIRAAVIEARPALAMLCAHFAAGSRHWAGQDALRAAGVCSLRSVHAGKAVSQCLFAPAGYRLGNITSLEGGIFCFTYDLRDDDLKLRAA